MSSSDPLSTEDDALIHHSLTSSEDCNMPPHCFTSSKDPNENVQTQRNLEDSGETKKKFDFLVWHGHCNQIQAERIYTELERKGLCGYIPERDKKLGQYKLTAMDEAIKNTANIILLLSKEALNCQEFNRKMHATITSTQSSVIPIYVGMRKAEGPRLLRHHVDIQYKDDESLWVRLHNSISRPKKPVEKTMDKLVGPSKLVKKESSTPNSSPLLQKRTTQPITLVPGPERVQARARRSANPVPKQSKSETKRGWFSFSSKKKEPEEPQGIPLKPVSSKKKDNGSVSL